MSNRFNNYLFFTFAISIIISLFSCNEKKQAAVVATAPEPLYTLLTPAMTGVIFSNMMVENTHPPQQPRDTGCWFQHPALDVRCVSTAMC